MGKMIGWLIAGGVILWVAMALLGGVGIYAIAHHKEPNPVTNVYIVDKIPQGPRPIVNVTDKVTVNVKEEPAPVVNVYPTSNTVVEDENDVVVRGHHSHYPTMHKQPAPYKGADKDKEREKQHESDMERRKHDHHYQ